MLYLRGLFAGLALAAAGLATEEKTSVTRWPQFRGVDGAGVAPDAMKLPVDFGPEKNVVWKTAVPPGHSSPCIWDDRLFLTGYDKKKKELLTLCVDRQKGRVLWTAVAAAEKIEKVHAVSSPAVATPVTDGQRVYAYFGSVGLLAYDFEGKEVWKHPLPVPQTTFGSGTSPVLAGDVLLIHCLDASPYLLAVSAATGKELWKVEKPKCGTGYSLPLVLRHEQGAEVLVHGMFGVCSYNLKDGKERWSSLGSMAQAIPTPVLGDGLLFLVSQMPGADLDDRWKLPKFDELLEKYDKDKDGRLGRQEVPKGLVIYSRGGPDGVGDITLGSMFAYIDSDKDGYITRFEWFAGSTMASMMQNTLTALRASTASEGKPPQTAWKEKASLPESPSPLYYQSRLYLVRNRGLFSCWDAQTGKQLYDERLGATGHYYASPVAGDGKVYVCSSAGVVTVLKAGVSFNILAKNDLGETIMATPALVDGKIYLRTEGHLYAFGE